MSSTIPTLGSLPPPSKLPFTPSSSGTSTPQAVPSFLLSPSSSSRRLPGPVTTTSSRNPISLRLYKVLGANYQDASTREALETLSSFYSPVPNVEGPKVEKEDSGSDDGDHDEAWGVRFNEKARKTTTEPVILSDDIAARARKNLRRDVETRLTDQSRKFLQAFAEVDQKLDVLQLHVKVMHAQCDEAQNKLQATHDGCKQLLERAGGLRAQRQTTNTHLSIVNLLLRRFTLTDEEKEALTSRDVPVGKAVFDALDRVESIRNDCRVLLSGDEGDTKAGLDIMAMTSDLLDQGFQKLTRWCSFEFRQLGRDTQLEVDNVLRETVRRLRLQPELLSEALKVLTEVRQNALMNSFIDALTRGGPGGLPRPIEMHAHDPTRYVGDMLAWVHQAMAGERELLEGLFDVKGDGRMMGSVRKLGDTEEEQYIQSLLDTDLEKLCMPLKVRVQQTVKSQEGSITSYKIANLLQFYMLTIVRTIGEEAVLSRTLKQVTDVAYQVFLDTIEAQGRSLLRFLHPPDGDLSPPLSLRDSCQVLREIMGVYESSLLGSEDPQERQDAFREILDAAVNPTLEMCITMSELRKDMTVWDKAVFLINCMIYIQNTLHAYSFTGAHVSMIQSRIDQHVQTLVMEHYLLFLQESGLAPITKAIDTTPADTPLSRIPEASAQGVSAALTQFDTFLSNLDVASSPRLLLLSVPRISNAIHEQAIRKVGMAYGKVCDAVRKSQNRYEFAGTLLGSRRPFGEMRVLWQVLGIDPEAENNL